MILYKVLVRDGESQYEELGYYSNFSAKDYDNGKITDQKILSELYDEQFTEKDLEPETTDNYWYGNKILSVASVRDILENEILVLHKFGIVYYTQGGQQ